METTSSGHSCDEVDKAAVLVGVVPDSPGGEVDSMAGDVGMTSITQNGAAKEAKHDVNNTEVVGSEGVDGAGGNSLSTNNEDGSDCGGVDLMVALSVENGDLRLPPESVEDKPEAEAPVPDKADGAVVGAEADDNDMNGGSVGCLAENRHSWHLDKSINK
nr:uncharacterized protein LOC115265254 [Aedes albopictus]